MLVLVKCHNAIVENAEKNGIVHFVPWMETYFMQNVNFKISSTCLKEKKYSYNTAITADLGQSSWKSSKPVLPSKRATVCCSSS